MHQTNPSFALRTGREQSLGWTAGCQSPIGHPCPTVPSPSTSTAKGRPSLETTMSPNPAKPQTSPQAHWGSATPGLRRATRPPAIPALRRGAVRAVLQQQPGGARVILGTNRIFNSKVSSCIICRCRHLGCPEQEDVCLDCSGTEVCHQLERRPHSWLVLQKAASAFRDGLSISDKSSSDQGNLSST